jgi:hypothetical protein
MTTQQYANAKVRSGQFPMMSIEASTFGGAFWLMSDDREPLASFMSVGAAEKARSKAIETACRRYA